MFAKMFSSVVSAASSLVGSSSSSSQNPTVQEISSFQESIRSLRYIVSTYVVGLLSPVWLESKSF